MRNKSGCKWREILLFSRWKPQGPRQQSHSELFFAFSYRQHFNIFGSSPDRFWTLHLVVKSFTHQLFDFMGLTLWNMVWKKIINGYYSNTFYFAMTNKNQAGVSEHLSTKHQPLLFLFFLSDFPNRCTTILLKLIAVVIRHLGNRWK